MLRPPLRDHLGQWVRAGKTCHGYRRNTGPLGRVSRGPNILSGYSRQFEWASADALMGTGERAFKIHLPFEAHA